MNQGVTAMKEISRRKFLNDCILSGPALIPVVFTIPERRRIPTSETTESSVYPSYLKLYREGILSQRIKDLYKIYEECHLCPRNCRVNRLDGKTGKCKASSKVKLSSAAPHFGEERPLVGLKGSGTIFFSNCGLRCVYCQNYSISIDGEGIEVSDDRLAESMLKIQDFGCHNVNLVTPTHYLPNIVGALNSAIPLGLRIPLVYNTSGYEKLEVLQLLEGIVDIYLPDFKYMDSQHAASYSSEAYNYPFFAKIALKEMFRQVGDLKVSGRGIAEKGLMVRHLILPNRIAGTQKFVRFVAQELSKTTYVNIMRQYRPEHKAMDYPEIARRLHNQEYTEAIQWAREEGLTRLAR
jgi:putative pyruvate formate lyase activating enzyme